MARATSLAGATILATTRIVGAAGRISMNAIDGLLRVALLEESLRPVWALIGQRHCLQQLRDG